MHSHSACQYACAELHDPDVIAYTNRLSNSLMSELCRHQENNVWELLRQQTNTMRCSAVSISDTESKPAECCEYENVLLITRVPIATVEGGSKTGDVMACVCIYLQPALVELHPLGV